MNKKTHKIDFAVGGQALMEGVLMRSPNFNIISVRAPNGKIVEKVEEFKSFTIRHQITNIPILRGVINMFEMLIIGTKALNFSSLITLGENLEKTSEKLKNKSKKSKKSKSNSSNVVVIFSMIFGLGLAIFLFKFLPLWITDWLGGQFSFIEKDYLVFNLVDAVIKTLIFICYLYIMTLSADLRRVLMYHGAEHKSIMTYEKGLPLTIENARKQSRFHPRCGTSFLLLIFLISVIIFTLLPKNPDFLGNFLQRLLVLPLIAGISYEILKYSARHINSIFFCILSKPGLWMQRLTTLEPDDLILEVGINSLKLALENEQTLKNKKSLIKSKKVFSKKSKR